MSELDERQLPAISTLLGPIQLALHHDRVRGWLLFDHRGKSVVAARLLGLSRTWASRGGAGGSAALGPGTEHRFFYWIPAEGLPVAIAHEDDLAVLPDLPGERAPYRTALGLRTALEKHLPREGTVLVEHGPFAQIADLAVVDEATLSLLRGRETAVRSSIELSNRFAGPLSVEERADVVEVASRLERAVAAFEVGARAARPTRWEAVWELVEASARAEGLCLHPESGLAIDAVARGQRAPCRGGGELEPRSRARVDLWASREGGAHSVVVPCSFEVSARPLPAAGAALGEELARCEEELHHALEERAKRSRLLGSEVGELAHDGARRRDLAFLSSCVGWPLGPVVRGSHACTFDSEGFADPRELVAGTCWALRLGASRQDEWGWRTSLLERTERGVRILARGQSGPIVLDPG